MVTWALTSPVNIRAFVISPWRLKNINAANRASSSSKARAQIRSAIDKLDKLWEVESDRTAFAKYPEQIGTLRRDLEVGDAASSTIYALSLGNDKDLMINHLKQSRRGVP